MKKIGTVQAFRNEIFKEQKLTICMDLGDRWSFYCVLEEAGKIIENRIQNTRNQRLQTGFFAESHAAAIKHIVIMVEKTMGVVKAYLKLKAVTAAKQIASAHAVRRMRAKISAGRPPSCHANTAANKRNTEKKNPNALKKSQ